MKKILWIVGLLMVGAVVSNAGVHVSFGFGIPVAPAPVYVRPAPVVVAPAPVYVPVQACPPRTVVYYRRPPVVVAPAPVVPAGVYIGVGGPYYGRPYYWRGRHWHGCQ